MLIKFDNGILYQKNLKAYVENFFELNKLKLVSWSRIDICNDFNMFNKKLNPDKFINRINRDIYLKTGWTKRTVISKQKLISENEYLKYGSYNCDVSSKLYNKTKEMQEVKHKKHIYASWVKAGLNMDSNIWRLEFNINNTRKDLLIKHTGELINLNNMEILKPENIYILYQHLLLKNFKFKINNYRKNKSRMKSLKLLSFKKYNCQLIDKESIADYSRVHKITVKQLVQHNRDVRTFKENNDARFDLAISQFIEDKGLNEWAKQKGFIA